MMLTPIVLLLLLAADDSPAQQRVLRHSAVIDAPVAEVWRAYTTAEGMTAWAAPWCQVDLRIGGTIETSYAADARPGDPDNIVQRILAYEPERMLTTRNEKSPANSPHREVTVGLWGVVHFEELSGERTRVSGSMLGWPDGKEADAAWEFFDRVNPMVYEQLRRTLERGRPGAAETMEELSRMLGIWSHETRTPNGSFRAVNILESGPGPGSIFTRGFNGQGDGIHPHATTLTWSEPGQDVVRFVSLDEQDAVARGTIRLDEAGETLLWDWRSTDPNGNTTRFDIRTRMLDDDRYVMTMAAPGSGQGFDIEFTRLESIPAEVKLLLEQ